MVFIDSHADRGGGEEKRPRAMSLSVKAMVATAASHPKMWGRQKMWGRRPFDPKCGDVKWGPENVGTSTGCGDVAGNGKCGDVARIPATSPHFRGSRPAKESPGGGEGGRRAGLEKFSLS